MCQDIKICMVTFLFLLKDHAWEELICVDSK